MGDQASNGQTSKVKKAPVSQKGDLKKKGKAPNAQRSNGAQGSDNRELKGNTEDLVNKINTLNVNIKDHRTLIGTKTTEKNDMGEEIKKQQSKKTKTGTKIEELVGKKGELVAKKGKLREEIKNLDLRKEELVKAKKELRDEIKDVESQLKKLMDESIKLGDDIARLENSKIRTETEIATMNEEETALVVEKGNLEKQLDEKIKMRFDNLEKGKQELLEENEELKKQLVDKEEEMRLEKEKTRLEKEKTRLEKQKLQNLQKKYDRRCCSCWSIC
ncbi:reticulocyte-binding protein 2 homolog a-like [Hordeum vulgare subsp. vulgare]|uniref:Uncharacterized protein n=1 Tax=Hordeum vulgare subsp. vulgare TaxID=112509 RepID=A0A8I7BK43_HORVV|nr:reticulocyte-binding protein 2 homolog a-like [Hordeum vulgare subsp. vulgare]